MFAPSYLSDQDRKRLAEINQKLLTGLTSEERSALLKEQQEISGRSKHIKDCTFEELQDLRQQLFEQFQKHSAIGSSQTQQIARFIQQVELREYTMLQQQAMQEKVVQKEEENAKSQKPTRPGKVSTNKNSYSWTVDIGGDD